MTVVITVQTRMIQHTRKRLEYTFPFFVWTIKSFVFQHTTPYTKESKALCDGIIPQEKQQNQPKCIATEILVCPFKTEP